MKIKLSELKKIIKEELLKKESRFINEARLRKSRKLEILESLNWITGEDYDEKDSRLSWSAYKGDDKPFAADVNWLVSVSGGSHFIFDKEVGTGEYYQWVDENDLDLKDLNADGFWVSREIG